jgi:hypothetical protein
VTGMTSSPFSAQWMPRNLGAPPLMGGLRTLGWMDFHHLWIQRRILLFFLSPVFS